MAYECPDCGSDTTQKVLVIYQHGTSDMTAYSGMSSTQGRSQTKLARSLAPPAYRSVGAFMLLGLLCVGASVPTFLQGEFVFIAIAVVLGLLALILFVLGFKNSIWNSWERPKLYAAWKEKWYCHRCGTVFTPV